MPPAKLNDVFKEVEKSIRYQRFIGMSAFIYSNNQFQRSRKWLIISIICLSGNLIIFFYTHYSIRKSLMYISKWYCYLKSAYSTVLVGGIVASWYHSNKDLDLLNAFLSRMRAVDLEMLSQGKKMPWIKSNFVIAFVYWLLTVAYCLKSSIMHTLTQRIQLLILYAPYLLIISFQDNIDRISCMLRLRFNAIKRNLVECIRIESKKAVPLIEKLVLCHHHLSTSSKDIDEYFSVQVVSLLTVFFLSTFCELYAIYIIYRDVKIVYREVILAEKGLWIIMMTTIMARICHQFAVISTEVSSFTKCIF